MFTKRASRREQKNGTEYIEPFSEPDTEAEHKPERTGYMAELEAWLDEFVFEPIERAIADEDTKELHIAFAEAKQQIKRKVLASYHNGLKAKTNPKSNERLSYRRN